jgi:ribonuclease HI
MITFGKYKGKTLQHIYKIDKQYLEWLCSQIWFKERHSELYEDTIKVKNTKIEKYEDKFLIYTDGACPYNGSSKARSSIGIHFSDKNEYKIEDISEKLNVKNHSNNVAELLAIKKSLEIVIENKITMPIHLYTDSAYCKAILEEWYVKWVRNDLLDNKKNLEIIKQTYDLYKSIDNIEIHKVKGHTTNIDEHSYGNRIADKLARGALKS